MSFSEPASKIPKNEIASLNDVFKEFSIYKYYIFIYI
jgi:hypothetical protein